jgi:hypothetical protein
VGAKSRDDSPGFDFDHFLKFLNSLRISTKERGTIALGKNLIGPQRRLLDEMRKGFAQGQHEFYVLKARQQGVSTLLLAFDMYYAFRFPGLPGVIVTHDEPAREQFRATLELYYDGLPSDWQQTVVQHNRHQLVLENRSMLQYKVAGLREASAKALGRSSAVSFGHMTEVAFWGDEEQIDSLKASMAEKNPLRCFVWESTARGFNHWHRMWHEALQSKSVRPIFIGWWANEHYRLEQTDPLYETYGVKCGRYSDEEKQRKIALEKQFGIILEDEQIAWYRWCQAEKVTEELRMLTEYPTLPEDAFQATGSKYFTAKSLGDSYRRVLSEKRPQALKFQPGTEFQDSIVTDTSDRQANLRIWEEPVKGAFYVLGADPAYGASEESDRSVACVLRCYANRMEQVAEFATSEVAPYVFAWLICYLAGAYEPCVVNLEINGSGIAVLQEMANLRKGMPRKYAGGAATTWRSVTAKMSEYMYTRPDSIGGVSNAKHTISSERVKESYMGLTKDAFERGLLITHSRDLLDEMKVIIRDSGRIAAQGRSHDDRVIALALGVQAWNDMLRMKLMARGVIFKGDERQEEAKEPGFFGRQVRDYLQGVGAIARPKRPDTGVRAYFPVRR